MSAPGDPVTTPLGGAHEGAPAVLAQYADLGTARHAMQQLEAQGVDGDDIALVGASARQLEGHAHRERTDRRILSHAGSAIALGVVAGGAIGAVIGAVLVGAILLLWDGLDARAWVFGLMIGWFAAGGALLGAFAGVSRAIGFSESIPITFEDEADTPPWLAVYGPREKLLPIVEATDPIEIGWSARTTHPGTTAAPGAAQSGRSGATEA
jgi:hypothetical protein